MNLTKVGQTKASKYGNIKTTIDGYKFDSKAEAKRYSQLKLLMRSGKIDHLVLQPEFVIHEAFTHEGKKYQEIKYISDFKYIDFNGIVHVEDVKGSKKSITDVYSIKKKMFLCKFGVEVQFTEIYNP